MALTGNQKAYIQARSGIARSGAIRSNYVWPLFGVITIDGFDITKYIKHGSLRVGMALNEEPDTASFDCVISDSVIDATVAVGANIVIGLGGPTENALFGGRILTTQTTLGPARSYSVRSVMCADYLQVLDSEFLITYDWPAQSATLTILDLIARFANKSPQAVAISTAGVQTGLPNHQAFAVSNERFSTVLRRLVTLFPTGGGFYVDPLKVLHVWNGISKPNEVDPSPLAIDNAMLKAFSETVDNSQYRDAVIVEGMRTTAPLGTPGPHVDDPSGRNLRAFPVEDASFLRPSGEGISVEVRVGTLRIKAARAMGPWDAPVGTPQTALTTMDHVFNPDPGIEQNTVRIFVDSLAFLTGRLANSFVRIDEQYLYVLSTVAVASPYLIVPRTGYGAQIGPIKTGAVVTAIDSLASAFVTQRYDAPGSPEKIRPQPIDSEVVLTVRSTTGAAIHEQIVQDGRFTQNGAAGRGAREAEDFRQALRSIRFETDDLNARPGRKQTYSIVDPSLGTPHTGELMILTADLTWPKWGDPPRRACEAATVHAANVIDAWLVDRR